MNAISTGGKPPVQKDGQETGGDEAAAPALSATSPRVPDLTPCEKLHRCGVPGGTLLHNMGMRVGKESRRGERDVTKGLTDPEARHQMVLLPLVRPRFTTPPSPH